MTPQPSSSAQAEQGTAAGDWSQPPTASSPPPPIQAAAAAASERPEIAAGAAFAAGFLVAKVLGRLAGPRST